MNQDTPSRFLDKIVIRVPDGLRDRIAVAAKTNGRSVNSELVATLSEKYPAPRDEEFERFIEFVTKLDPEEMARLTQLLLERDLASGKITHQDIEDGLVPGIGMRKLT